jgi:hypothetical protein
MFDIGFMCIAVIICMCDGLKVKLVDMAGRMHLYKDLSFVDFVWQL